MRTALTTALVLLLTLAGAAHAHVRSSTGYSDVRGEGSTVRYDLSVETAALDAAAGDGTFEAYVLPRVQVYLDGVECEGAAERAGAASRDGRDHTRIALGFECPGSPGGAYEIRYGVFADGSVVDDHTNVARYDLAGHAGTFVFDAGNRELEAGEASLPETAGRFVAIGVEHILFGVDHVLFLLALLLGARSLGQVVKLATVFTAAHSVTLALGALGWVNVPPEIVEPLIALSIAYVAADVMLGNDGRHRLPIVFAFGLLHGLGFAGSLSWSGDIDLAALATFNVGIELGQALIVLAVFPVLLLVRRLSWSPYAHAGAAACAGGFGLLWFFERLMEAG
jgi:hydrogenase/urease accessory protein HupE